MSTFFACARTAPVAALVVVLAAPLGGIAEDAALDKRLDVNFIETPLADVADFLRDAAKVNVALDARALEEVGVGADTPVTFHAQGIRLKIALQLILRQLDLAYDFHDGGLRITTPEAVESNLRTFVYPAQHLLTAREPFGGFGRHGRTMDDLIDVTQSAVRPTAWDQVGGPGSMAGFRGLLIVTTTYETYQEVAAFLHALEQGVRTAEASGRKPPPVACFPQPVKDDDEEKILAALARPAELSVIEVPLVDVVKKLADEAKITILLDDRALEDVGLSGDTPVTRNLKGISLGSLLRLVLREMDLAFYVRGGVLLITTPEECEQMLVVRVFPVLDLVLPDEALEPLESLKAGADYDSLIDIVTTTVRPTTWDEVGGPGAIDAYRGCLVFAQTDDVYGDVADLLAGLRKVKAQIADAPDHPSTDPVALDELRQPALARLRRRLQAEVGMHGFMEAPLQDVVDQLKERCGVEIQIDHKALDDVGIGSDQSVTASLGGESLGAALRRILRPFELTWVLRDEVILITSPDKAESTLETRLYPVADLVVDDDALGGTPGAFDELIETLTSTVASGSWEEVGGPGSIVAYRRAPTLVVSQSEEVHERIANVLAQLRKVQADAPSAGDGPEKPAGEQPEILRNKTGQRLHLKAYRLKSPKPEDAQQIAETIAELVEPESWKSGESYVLRGVTGAVVVRHTAKAHRAIHALLTELDVLVPRIGSLPGGFSGGGLSGFGGGVLDAPGERADGVAAGGGKAQDNGLGGREFFRGTGFGPDAEPAPTATPDDDPFGE